MVIQILNSKLGITLRVSVTYIDVTETYHDQPSSRPREPYTKIHKYGLNHDIMTYR